MKETTKGHEIIKKLLHRPNHLLATILITNNFVNVAIIILSTYITTGLFNFNGFTCFGIHYSSSSRYLSSFTFRRGYS